MHSAWFSVAQSAHCHGLLSPGHLCIRALLTTPEGEVRRHSGATYRIYFAHLGGLPAGLAMSRRATPRRRAAGGSFEVELDGGRRIDDAEAVVGRRGSGPRVAALHEALADLATRNGRWRSRAV